MEFLHNYGWALEQLNVGNKVARIGWNGKGMFLFRVDGKSIEKVINDTYGHMLLKDFTPVDDATYMYTAGSTVIPWLPSQADNFAEDWVVVE